MSFHTYNINDTVQNECHLCVSLALPFHPYVAHFDEHDHETTPVCLENKFKKNTHTRKYFSLHSLAKCTPPFIHILLIKVVIKFNIYDVWPTIKVRTLLKRSQPMVSQFIEFISICLCVFFSCV